MNTNGFRNDLEICLRNAYNNNEDIPQLISTLSGNSKDMKQILETIYSIIQFESMITKQNKTEVAVSVLGLECASTDTFPAMSLAAKSKESNMMSNFSKAVDKSTCDEYPLSISVGAKSDEIFLSGMDETRRNIYNEKLKKEYGVYEI